VLLVFGKSDNKFAISSSLVQFLRDLYGSHQYGRAPHSAYNSRQVPHEVRITLQPSSSAERSPLPPHRAKAGLDGGPVLARAAPLLVLAVTLLAYSAVSSFQFVYDDDGQIVHDSFVQHWRYLPAFFTTHVWQYVTPYVPGNYYRPVFMIWLLLNFKLFGLHPGAWHLAVLALHLVVTWQVYRLVLRILGNEPAALASAAIFGLHPVHVEAVAWISGATEPLVAMLMLASLLSYMAFRERKRARDYAISLAWFCLALFAKEPAVLVPVLLFAYDVLVPHEAAQRVAERIRSSLARLIPFALLLAGYLAARFHALRGLGHQTTVVSLKTSLLTVPSLLVFYVRLLLLPVRLSAFYETDYVTSLKAALLPTLLCLAMAAFAVGMLWRWRSRPATFALLIVVLPLLPLMKLSVFLRGEIAHDRYLYLPSIGFALLVGLLFRSVYGRDIAWERKVAIGTLLVVLALYFGGTMGQSLYWADNLVLYARGVRIAPNNLIARTDLGNELLGRGRIEDALAQYRNVLHRDPQFWLARYDLGYAEYSTNDCERASRDLQLASYQNPLDAATFFYLGQCRFRLGERGNGVALMRHGIDLDPRMPNFRAELADALVLMGTDQDLRYALELYRAEALGNPTHPTAARRANELEARLGTR